MFTPVERSDDDDPDNGENYVRRSVRPENRHASEQIFRQASMGTRELNAYRCVTSAPLHHYVPV